MDGVDRMRRGERIYSDFFEFHPPGGFLLLEGWLRLAGPSFIAVRFLAISTIVGIACFTYLSCLESSKNIVISAAAAVAWLIWSQLEWSPQISHHWFTTLFALISAWTALRSFRAGTGPSVLPVLSGLAAGAAAMITPTRGLLAALASLTAFVMPAVGRFRTAKFIGGCLVVPILLLLFLAFHGSLEAAFADAIVFPATQYSSIQTVPFGLGSRTNPLKYSYPIIIIMFAGVCVLDWRSVLRDRMLQACVAIAAAGMLGTYPRPDVVHIGFALPLSLPLAAYCLAALARRMRFAFVCAAGALGLLFCLPSTVHFIRDARNAINTRPTRTAVGDVAFQEDGAADLIDKLSSESGAYFFYPYMPMLPYLTAKKQTSEYDVFVPYYTTARQYREACEAVSRHASSVVIDTKWIDHDFFRSMYPAMKAEIDPRKAAFEAVLRQQFAPSWQSGEFQILRRTNTAPLDACSAIRD